MTELPKKLFKPCLYIRPCGVVSAVYDPQAPHKWDLERSSLLRRGGEKAEAPRESVASLHYGFPFTNPVVGIPIPEDKNEISRESPRES